jgi:hypothetical protein
MKNLHMDKTRLLVVSICCDKARKLNADFSNSIDKVHKDKPNSMICNVSFFFNLGINSIKIHTDEIL